MNLYHSDVDGIQDGTVIQCDGSGFMTPDDGCGRKFRVNIEEIEDE